MLTTWVCSAIPSRSRYLRSDYITCTILPGYASVLDTCIDSEVQMKTGFAAVHRHTRPSLSPIRCPKLLLCGTYTGEWNHTVIDSTIWRSIEANHVQGILCYLSKDKYDSSLQIIYHLSRYNCSDTLGQAYLICFNQWRPLLSGTSILSIIEDAETVFYATAHFDSISARHPARLVLTSLVIWKVDECDTAIQQAQDCFWWW